MCTRCNAIEDVEHFLMRCQEHARARRKTFDSLRQLGVTQLNLKNLLGGGNFNKDTQLRIRDIIGRFIVESGRANSL